MLCAEVAQFAQSVSALDVGVVADVDFDGSRDCRRLAGRSVAQHHLGRLLWSRLPWRRRMS